MILQNRYFDIKKIDFLISQNHFDLLYQKNDFVISKDGISDIKISISQNQNYFLISQKRICDIKNDFVILLNRYDSVISKRLFCDITN